jgi:hypothetical protein
MTNGKLAEELPETPVPVKETAARAAAMLRMVRGSLTLGTGEWIHEGETFQCDEVEAARLLALGVAERV